MQFSAGMNSNFIVFIGVLVLFVLVAVLKKRPLKYNGEQERLNKKSLFIWTLGFGTGTSFPSKNKRVLGVSEVSSRRKKFGIPTVLKILWFIGIAAGLIFATFL